MAIAAVGALLVHRRFPWVPPLYLGVLIALPAAGWRVARWRVARWRVARWRGADRRVRWPLLILVTASFVALWPVPWMQADLDDPPGSAWRLDGRLVINGATVDPPGTWYWLTVGRPPLVAEVVRSWFGDRSDAPTNMLGGRRALRPAAAEPAAAAIGLRRAGWPIELRLVVEVSDPLDARLPARAVLAMVNDLELTTRDGWESALRGLHQRNTFTTVGGDSYEFRGPEMPYQHVDVMDAPQDGFDAAVGGPLARTVPGSWYRELSLGSSHGLMVALVAYTHGSEQDLAGGRAIAGTGTIRGDGTVGRIGGLWAKATAAREIGVEVLLFPAQQAIELRRFDPGAMRLLPVASLDEAIAALGG
jgi:hypothetical protein